LAVLAATVVLAFFGLALPAIAAAESFEVNSAADEADAAIGTGGCASAAGKCTLRAAIQEADASGESSQIEFFEEVFAGGAGSTITLGSELPPITVPMRISGHLCEHTALGVEGPCVTLDGAAVAKALRVEGAAGVEIAGVAITGAGVGIEVDEAELFRATRDWFGVSPTGATAGDGVGLIVGPGSDGSRIGTEGLGSGNVFADGTGDGLEILGARGAIVLSNYFGVSPDGATPAPNAGADIAVASTLGHEASGTQIGTDLKAPALATPECDRGCNVISGAGTSGVDLTGAAGTGPPAATAIAGNFIGLDAAGTGAVANAGAGVLVGAASETVIGGPRVGEANYIAGGATGVSAGPAAPDLVVRGNRIGLGLEGAPTAAPTAAGIAIDSGSLPSVALEAIVAANQVRMEGGVGISATGFGASIAANSVTGGATGIETLGEDGGHGSVISGNSVSGTTASGIAVENELNEILGNEVSSAGAAGILVDGSQVEEGIFGNRVGGDSAGEENAIDGSGGAAVEILNRHATETEVARNHGSLNAGPFISLVRSSESDAEGPNFGIQPPAFATMTETGASGTGAEPGALVRVFRKQLPEAGEMGSFLGEARADSNGDWEVTYAEAVPAATPIAASQTSEEAATSELALATTSGTAPGGGGGPSGEPGGGSGDSSGGDSAGSSTPETIIPVTLLPTPKPTPKPKQKKAKPPQTWILTGTREGSPKAGARFSFNSDQIGSKYECRIDRWPFRPCRSPQRFGGLKPGRHTFEARAVGRSGIVDRTPAQWRFTVR
jgi:CSLREA domain-containing protein